MLQTLPDVPGEVLDTSQARPTGRVVGIIRRNWRTRGYCGSLQPPQHARQGTYTQSVLFCPAERRYPMIRLQNAAGEPASNAMQRCPKSCTLNRPKCPTHVRVPSLGWTAAAQLLSSSTPWQVGPKAMGSHSLLHCFTWCLSQPNLKGHLPRC